MVVRAAGRPSPAAPQADPDRVLDPGMVLDRVDGDAELLRELVAIFLEDCPRSMSGDRGGRRPEGRRGPGACRARAEGLDRQLRLRAPRSRPPCGSNSIGREGDLSGVDEAWADLRDAVAQFQPALTALAGLASGVKADAANRPAGVREGSSGPATAW